MRATALIITAALSLLLTNILYAANPRSRVELAALKSSLANRHSARAMPQSRSADTEPETDDEITHYPFILEISVDADETLDALRAVVFHNRGNLYLVCIPIEMIDDLPRDNRVNAFQMASYNEACLDVARRVSNVDAAHTRLGTLGRISENTSEASSVVTGICDTGFDPAHAAFRNSLKRWTLYDEYHGRRQVFDSYDNIIANAPTTDNERLTHATHVGNILAGNHDSYPYYGVAPATDFVVSTSSLTDVGICSGIEDIIDYARETGRRAVVNISAGSYLGPHDGKDLVGRYLSAMADEAVICFSAGNYGTRQNCQSLDLDNYPEAVGSTWCDSSWTGFNVYGGTDFWSRDEKPFEFRFVVWDTSGREYKYVTDWMGADGNDGDCEIELGEMPWFTEGLLLASWGVCKDNRRFNVAIEYNYKSETAQTAGPWANYAVAYQIRKVVDNTHVDVYADGIYSFLHGRGFGVPFSEAGTPDGSISNLACCPDVVAVGAWNSRTIFPDVETGTFDRGIATDCVASWSAYGTSGDGRLLPHFAAPGNALVSALSTPHSLFDGPKDDADRTAAVFDGYGYFAAAGTSMASPFAAGIFALWLDFHPRLDVRQLVDIACRTANRDFADISDPRWGAGAIDALAGLEEIAIIKGNDGVDNVTADSKTMPRVILTPERRVEVVWPGVDSPEVSVYDLSGRRIELPALPYGFFIVTVADPASSRRFAFRIG